MIGSASIMSPMVEGMVSRNISRMARASSDRNAVDLIGDHEPRQERQRDRAERDAEQAERKLHQPEGNGEPEDGAVAERRGKHGIDQDVDLRRARRDDRGSHQSEDGEYALVPPLEIRMKAVAQRLQRRQLHHELQGAADERADRETDERTAGRNADRSSRRTRRRR